MYIKEKISEWYRHRHPDYVMNINRDLLDREQKCVLLCYVKDSLKLNFESDKIYHPNKLRANQMITALVRLGYSVDVCDFNEMGAAPILKKRSYHGIIGFGPLYEILCREMNIPNRIVYITENDPRTLSDKYRIRKEYFHQRHPEVKKTPSSERIQYYTSEQFELSNKAIIMTSECNSAEIRKQLPDFATIKVNGMFNPNYKFSLENLGERRKQFLWFGSTGYIQKGLDILIDVFRELPELTLDVYGLPEKEKSQLVKQIIIPANVNLWDMVSIQSNEFLELVKSHLYIISASCMEGMQSGVATCMRHGMIPLLTKECGYEEDEPVILFDDYRVESILNKIKEMDIWPDEKLAEMSKEVFDYANQNHTLDSISRSFSEVFKKMLG